MRSVSISQIYGCTLASWAAGTFISADITLQANAGAGWVTLARTTYRLHPRIGIVEKLQLDSVSSAEVDWSTYQTYQDAGNVALRATYYLYDESTNAITAGSPYTTEAQTLQYVLTGGNAMTPTGTLVMTSSPMTGVPLIGDYLSLGAAGTRPVDATHGTGIWADKLGMVGLNAGVVQFSISAVTGKATFGAGAVTNDVGGISIASGSGTANLIKFVSGSTSQAVIYYSAGAFLIQSNLDAAAGTGNILLQSLASGKEMDFTLNSNGYAVLYAASGTFTGLALDATGVGTAPSAYLDLIAAAPTILFNDTTASAKKALLKNDADVFGIYEYNAGTPTQLVTVGLANGNVSALGNLRLGGSTTGKVTMRAITNLADNGTIQVSDGAADNAMIFIISSAGVGAIFHLRGGVHSTVLMSTAGLFSITAATASNTNVYWSAGNSYYELENKTGGTRSYQIIEFLTG